MKKRMLFLIILFSFLFGCLQNTTEKTTEQKSAELIQLMNEKYSKTESPQITLIANADELKANQKAIYEDAENGMFLIQWPDLLVIYDYDNQKVVQELAITNVNLG